MSGPEVSKTPPRDFNSLQLNLHQAAIKGDSLLLGEILTIPKSHSNFQKESSNKHQESTTKKSFFSRKKSLPTQDSKQLFSTLDLVNSIDENGYTALQKASSEGHEECVRLLLAHGAQVNQKDFIHGNTALHEASWKGYSRTVKLLTTAGAQLNLPNNGGFAPLHLCCQNGHNQTCRELLIASADPDLQNNYGDTPLHTSARYGHAGVTRILISAQCHVSDQNKNGDTALHISAAMGRRKLTKILLEAGCDKNLVNKQNETAKEIALRKNLTEIINIIDTTQLQKPKHVKATKKTVPQHFKHWSPYGCHYYPDPKTFPKPKLHTLPQEPLKHGEQYYLDLAGNIKKGPIGVGYTCYCAPLFKQIEEKLDKDKNELKAHIDKAQQKLNHKVSKLELKTQVQINELTKCLSRNVAGRFSERPNVARQQSLKHQLSISRSKSLEILDEKSEIIKNSKSVDFLDETEGPSDIRSNEANEEVAVNRQYLLNNYLDSQQNSTNNYYYDQQNFASNDIFYADQLVKNQLEKNHQMKLNEKQPVDYLQNQSTLSDRLTDSSIQKLSQNQQLNENNNQNFSPINNQQIQTSQQYNIHNFYKNQQNLQTTNKPHTHITKIDHHFIQNDQTKIEKNKHIERQEVLVQVHQNNDEQSESSDEEDNATKSNQKEKWIRQDSNNNHLLKKNHLTIFVPNYENLSNETQEPNYNPNLSLEIPSSTNTQVPYQTQNNNLHFQDIREISNLQNLLTNTNTILRSPKISMANQNFNPEIFRSNFVPPRQVPNLKDSAKALMTQQILNPQSTLFSKQIQISPQNQNYVDINNFGARSRNCLYNPPSDQINIDANNSYNPGLYVIDGNRKPEAGLYVLDSNLKKNSPSDISPRVKNNSIDLLASNINISPMILHNKNNIDLIGNAIKSSPRMLDNRKSIDFQSLERDVHSRIANLNCNGIILKKEVEHSIDSGYSTKVYGSSQGNSPSLLELDHQAIHGQPQNRVVKNLKNDKNSSLV